MIKRCSRILLGLLAAAFVSPALFAVEPLPPGMELRMVDPVIDETGPFCYLVRTSNQLSMISSNRAAQVTYDGAIYTGSCEFVLLHGDPLRPIMVRQKTNLEGYIPVLSYAWQDGDVRFIVETYINSLDGNPLSINVANVRVTAENLSEIPAKTQFGAVTRFVGTAHRFQNLKNLAFSPAWDYEMRGNALIRGGGIIMVYPEPTAMEAVPGVPYEAPFASKDFKIVDNSEVGLVRYEMELGPREKRNFDFKVPTDPVPVGGEEEQALLNAKYDQFRYRTIASWKAQLAIGGQIELPEAKVLEAHKASLMYPMEAIFQNQDGQWVQGVNMLHYRWFWLRDAAYIIHAYDVWGQHDIARRVLAVYPKYQEQSGLFQSQQGQLDGFGQALYALGEHAVMTNDEAYARAIYPMFPPAVEWLKQARANDPLKLMPSTTARDNELITGHYTGHNFWALLGLRTAARVAKMAGHDEQAAEYMAQYDDLYAALMKQIQAVCGDDGALPPGLDEKGGQDWGNLIGVFPTEVLSPDDPHVAATAKKMHEEKFVEGLMSYQYSLHHYLTVKEAQNHIMMGDQEQAVRDFYQVMLHMGSANEMFEFLVLPWGDRDPRHNFTPHGWGAAMYNLMLRNMLIHERGGNGGLDGREIHLFSAISPEWAKPGESISLLNMPTELGRVSAKMTFSATGAQIAVDPVFHKQPTAIVVHIPWFVELESFECDAEHATREGDSLILPPNARRVSMRWKRKEVEPLSYAQAVEDYKREYRRRFEDYIKSGKEPLAVEPVTLMTAEERAKAFEEKYANIKPGVLVGGRITTSADHERHHPPLYAVDGNTWDRNSGWFVGPPAPQWLMVEIAEPRTIDRVAVYTYWDGTRYYQYSVEVSLDGENWDRVVDMSENTKPSTPAGDWFEIEPRQIRFLRITMLHNSANPSMHLVEVKALAPGE